LDEGRRRELKPGRDESRKLALLLNKSRETRWFKSGFEKEKNQKKEDEPEGYCKRTLWESEEKASGSLDLCSS
jgi:hypothetical protein